MKKLLFILAFLPALALAEGQKLGQTNNNSNIRLTTDTVSILIASSTLKVSTGILNVNSTINPIVFMNPDSIENNESNLASVRWDMNITSINTQAAAFYSKLTNRSSSVNPLADGNAGHFWARDVAHNNNGVLEGIVSRVTGQGVAPEYAALMAYGQWIDDGTNRGTTSTIVGLQSNVQILNASSVAIATGTKYNLYLTNTGHGATGQSWAIYSIDDDPSFFKGNILSFGSLSVTTASFVSYSGGDMTNTMNINLTNTSGGDGNNIRVNASGAQSQSFRIINAWDALGTYDYWKIGEFGTNVSMEVGSELGPLHYVNGGYASFLSEPNQVLNPPQRAILAVGKSTNAPASQNFFAVDQFSGDYTTTGSILKSPFLVSYDSGTHVGGYLDVVGSATFNSNITVMSTASFNQTVSIRTPSIVNPGIIIADQFDITKTTVSAESIDTPTLKTHNIRTGNSVDDLTINNLSSIDFNDVSGNRITRILSSDTYSQSQQYVMFSTWQTGQFLRVDPAGTGFSLSSIGNLSWSNTISTLTVSSTMTATGVNTSTIVASKAVFSSVTVTDLMTVTTITAKGSISASNDSPGVATLKLTQTNSGNSLDAPMFDLNGPANTINFVSPFVGPSGGNAMVQAAYVKINWNGAPTATVDGQERELYLFGGYEDCFDGKTKVFTPKGYKNIEDFKDGDEVYSLEPLSKGLYINHVGKFEKHPKGIVSLIVNEKIRTNLTHTFYANGNWVKTSDLKIGDWMMTKEGKKIWIYSLQSANERQLTYNLHMKNQGLPNYMILAGDDTILVHNKCPFLYYYNPNKKGEDAWEKQTTFLYGLDSKEKRTTQRRELKVLSRQFVIRELEPETSYIESLDLIAVTPKGEVRLHQVTPKSYKTKQGDVILVEFEPLPKDTKKLFIEATGYYEATE